MLKLINLPYYVVALYLSVSVCLAQQVSPSNYSIGEHNYQEYYVSTTGSDDNDGRSLNNAFKTLTQAYNQIPKGQIVSKAIRINLAAGNYPESDLPNFWEDIRGTENAPIVFSAIDGPGTVTLGGDINSLVMQYVYFLDLNIVPSPAGDAFHCEKCDHILLRRMTLNGGNTTNGAHETLKVNQSKYFYIEDSDISGADDNAIDFVAVQYGHITRSRIHNAADWCLYTKGGSAQITISNNLIYNCGTGGYTAGQGSGFEFMETPWLHYEAYDIKFVNNIIRDTEGAGIGVNGGYNILLAFNTLYKVGSRDHLIEVYRGRRGCDGTISKCNQNADAGGWGGTVSEEGVIPNKNIFIYNNLLYNPSGFQGGSQVFAIHEPQTTLSGFRNINFPVKADTNLQIRGNLIWSPSSNILGIEDTQACQSDNQTCNAAQLTAENVINTVEPSLAAPSSGDFRPTSGGNVGSSPTFSIPNFLGGDAPTQPVVPAGNLENTVISDFGGASRGTLVVGSYNSIESSLGTVGPGSGNPGDTPGQNPGEGSAPQISAFSAKVTSATGKDAKSKVVVNVTAKISDVDQDLDNITALITPQKVNKGKAVKLKGSGTYKGKATVKKSSSYTVSLSVSDKALHSSEQTITVKNKK